MSREKLYYQGQGGILKRFIFEASSSNKVSNLATFKSAFAPNRIYAQGGVAEEFKMVLRAYEVLSVEPDQNAAPTT